MSAFCVFENGKLSSKFQDYLQVTGNYNFFVVVEISRQPGTTNSTVVVTPFTKADRKKKVNAEVCWSQVSAAGEAKLESMPNQYQMSARGNLVLIRSKQVRSSQDQATPSWIHWRCCSYLRTSHPRKQHTKGSQ